MKLTSFRIFLLSLVITVIIIVIKYIFHIQLWEVVVLSSLHGSVISGAFFVIGFLLSTTIADYKESEKIPADFSSNLENMFEDASSIKRNHKRFKLKEFATQLRVIAESFQSDVRNKTRNAHLEIHKLNDHFAHMEKVDVPPNFIVKLKQQQAQILRSTMRVGYIQRITFIPSATILARSIVVLSITLLVFTKIDPFYGGLLITGGISFSMVYILKLISVISTPFHSKGATQDDVSLFLVNDTIRTLKEKL